MALDTKTISVDLNEEERLDAIEFYKARLSKLTDEVNKVFRMLNKLGYVPDDLGIEFLGPYSSATDKKEEYRTNWNWTLKIKYALKYVGRCMTTREIIGTIVKLEPVLNPETIINSISGTISTKASKGIIFKRYQAYQGSDYFVGLAEWFDNDEVKKEYRGD